MQHRLNALSRRISARHVTTAFSAVEGSCCSKELAKRDGRDDPSGGKRTVRGASSPLDTTTPPPRRVLNKRCGRGDAGGCRDSLDLRRRGTSALRAQASTHKGGEERVSGEEKNAIPEDGVMLLARKHGASLVSRLPYGGAGSAAFSVEFVGAVVLLPCTSGGRA